MMQKNNQNLNLQGGFLNKAFQEFDENAFFEALGERLEAQPFHRRNKGLKTTLLVLSYILAVISALSASYLVYWLTNSLTGVKEFAFIIAGIFLVFLEQLKRKSSNEFFQVYFFQKKIAMGWLILSLSCFGLSVSSTYFGTEKGAVEFAPEAPTLSIDASEQEVKDEIKRLENENADLKGQKNRQGITFFPLQKVIKSNKKIIVSLRERLNKKQDQREQDDRTQKGDHKEKIEVTATTLAWILVFLELLFEGCIAYIWYYYYRSFVEWNLMKQEQLQKKQNTMQTAPKNTPPPQHQNFTSPPPYSTNNSQSNGVHNQKKRSIGFVTGAQRKVEEQPKEQGETSVQVCTDLYREDLFTVPHIYTKGGQEITVRYTEPQVRGRLNQYKRDLEEAKQKNMDGEVIKNRQEWIGYWNSKLQEVQQKTQNHIV